MVDGLQYTSLYAKLSDSKESSENCFYNPQLEGIELEKMFSSYLEQSNNTTQEVKKLSICTDEPLEKSFVHLLDSPDDVTNKLNGLPNYQDLESLFSGQDSPLQEVICKQESKEENVTHQKKVKDAKVDEEEGKIDMSRVWLDVFNNDKIIKREELKNVIVRSKTRRDKPLEAVPERMYSSLKYEIQLTASGQFIKNVPFILARIKVVDSKTFEVVKKNNKDVLKGVIESALTQSNNDKHVFNGTLKVQFVDISYHHEKREFCWEIHYFTPDDLQNPIIIKRSAAFRVYARKPNQKKPKRKRDSDSASRKKQKVETLDQSPNFTEFCRRLEELVDFNKKLCEDERKRAMEMVLSKFMQVQQPLFNPYNMLMPTNQCFTEQYFNNQF